jgi:predicted RNA-binding protein associated with RNAse of E/G family
MTPARFNPDLALLQCCHPGGAPRYDLPASPVGAHLGYDIFWRPAPAPLFHHRRGSIIRLPESEFLLVGLQRCHCISLSVDACGMPTGCYVNINLVPKPTPQGWSWEDLELDVKVARDYTGAWAGFVLDHDEYEAAHLPVELRSAAEREVVEVLEGIRIGLFPFTEPTPWLGLAEMAMPSIDYAWEGDLG